MFQAVCVTGHEHLIGVILEVAVKPACFAGAFKDKLCFLEFTDRRMFAHQMKTVESRLQAIALPGKSSVFDNLEQELKEYFNGSRREFTVPLLYPGSEFQEKVWNQLLKTFENRQFVIAQSLCVCSTHTPRRPAEFRRLPG